MTLESYVESLCYELDAVFLQRIGHLLSPEPATESEDQLRNEILRVVNNLRERILSIPKPNFDAGMLPTKRWQDSVENVLSLRASLVSLLLSVRSKIENGDLRGLSEFVRDVTAFSALLRHSLDQVPPDSSRPVLTILWDPEVVDENDYSELVSAIGDMVRSRGGEGLLLLQSGTMGADVPAGVPQ